MTNETEAQEKTKKIANSPQYVISATIPSLNSNVFARGGKF